MPSSRKKFSGAQLTEIHRGGRIYQLWTKPPRDEEEEAKIIAERDEIINRNANNMKKEHQKVKNATKAEHDTQAIQEKQNVVSQNTKSTTSSKAGKSKKSKKSKKGPESKSDRRAKKEKVRAEKAAKGAQASRVTNPDAAGRQLSPRYEEQQALDHNAQIHFGDMGGNNGGLQIREQSVASISSGQENQKVSLSVSPPRIAGVKREPGAKRGPEEALVMNEQSQAEQVVTQPAEVPQVPAIRHPVANIQNPPQFNHPAFNPLQVNAPQVNLPRSPHQDLLLEIVTLKQWKWQSQVDITNMRALIDLLLAERSKLRDKNAELEGKLGAAKEAVNALDGFSEDEINGLVDLEVKQRVLIEKLGLRLD
ncbi:hypothetical protein G7Y89_g10032 [Cudoniella acicularis]|uniref:Uncharacterized protein n=1 Tax=Cudoniella acicularis TaxID=354080 RepID=A0A8H4RDI1_9HELO|nr:hypothetical protein G7Y89_g10032 [Cudoniella acicularis]